MKRSAMANAMDALALLVVVWFMVSDDFAHLRSPVLVGVAVLVGVLSLVRMLRRLRG